MMIANRIIKLAEALKSGDSSVLNQPPVAGSFLAEVEGDNPIVKLAQQARDGSLYHAIRDAEAVTIQFAGSVRADDLAPIQWRPFSELVKDGRRIAVKRGGEAIVHLYANGEWDHARYDVWAEVAIVELPMMVKLVSAGREDIEELIQNRAFSSILEIKLMDTKTQLKGYDYVYKGTEGGVGGSTGSPSEGGAALPPAPYNLDDTVLLDGVVIRFAIPLIYLQEGGAPALRQIEQIVACAKDYGCRTIAHRHDQAVRFECLDARVREHFIAKLQAEGVLEKSPTPRPGYRAVTQAVERADARLGTLRRVLADQGARFVDEDALIEAQPSDTYPVALNVSLRVEAKSPLHAALILDRHLRDHPFSDVVIEDVE